MTEPEKYPAFPSIPRMSRGRVWVAEKIDGTNALVYVGEDGAVRAGSRNRWLSPGKDTDNFGFAEWVHEHATELQGLGAGAHHGEWWGRGIQRGYGRADRQFSLFNAPRWLHGDVPPPSCCRVVPLLWLGEGVDATRGYECARELQRTGSQASPGYFNPEGVVVAVSAGGSTRLYKYTYDDRHKSEAGGQ